MKMKKFKRLMRREMREYLSKEIKNMNLRQRFIIAVKILKKDY